MAVTRFALRLASTGAEARGGMKALAIRLE